MNEQKTRLAHLMEKPGFQFLGYVFYDKYRDPRPSSKEKLKTALRAKTKLTSGQSFEAIIRTVNASLRGWFNYFKHAHRYTFPKVDRFVRRRLRAILRTQDKRPGRGRMLDDHQRWPNAFFAAHGLFTLTDVHAAASQSR